MKVELPDAQPSSAGAFVLHLPEARDDAWFAELAARNPDVRLERSAQGDLTLMPPTGTHTGDRDSEINMQLRLWARADGSGKVFSSSTGFRLPNGAIRSPDASWVSLERLATVTEADYQGFAPVCPEFVVELLSPTDSLARTQAIMREYLENGARLGWLLEPETKTVYVYVADGVDVIRDAERLSGEPVLKEFWLELLEVWS